MSEENVTFSLVVTNISTTRRLQPRSPCASRTTRSRSSRSMGRATDYERARRLVTAVVTAAVQRGHDTDTGADVDMDAGDYAARQHGEHRVTGVGAVPARVPDAGDNVRVHADGAGSRRSTVVVGSSASVVARRRRRRCRWLRADGDARCQWRASWSRGASLMMTRARRWRKA